MTKNTFFATQKETENQEEKPSLIDRLWADLNHWPGFEEKEKENGDSRAPSTASAAPGSSDPEPDPEEEEQVP